jgi:tetratricopeptide (TPR) repeat protein
MKDLVTSNEEKFEKETKQTKPFGFGFAPWESYYIDREVQFYNCVPNLLESNIPILICIGDDDIAMPMVLAKRTYDELMKNRYQKATFKVIEGEVHQYEKYEVFAIMDTWIDSKGETTEFVLDQEDKDLKEKYERIEEVSNCIASLSWEGGEPEKSLDCFQKVKEAQYEDPAQWFSLGVKLFANGHYQESFESFTQATDSSFIANFAAMAWLGHILDLQNERDQAVLWYKKALAHYPGFPVQHDQWGIIIDKKWLEERLKTPFTFEKK